MNRKLLAVVAVIAVAAGLVAWRGIPRVSAGTVQPDVNALALVPPQATSVFGLDLDGLRATAVYQAWKQKRDSQPKENDHHSEFLTRTGFDPERDVEGVTAAAWMAGTSTDPTPDALAVITARYNRSSLDAFAREKGAVVENYHGFEILTHPQKEGRRGPVGGFVLLDDHTILAGTLVALRQAIDLKVQPGPNVLNNDALLARVRLIGAENQVWGVSTAPGSFIPHKLPDLGQMNMTAVLQGLQASTFALNASYGLKLQAEGTCATDADARTLADAARGLLAIARLFAPTDKPEALSILTSFHVTQNDREVKVSAEIAPELLDSFITNPKSFFPQGEQRREHKREAK